MEQRKSILPYQDYRKDSMNIHALLIHSSRNFLADPNKNPNELQPHHQSTIHLNSESMIDLQNACKDALNGKPSRSPLIEMVTLNYPFNIVDFLSGHSFITRSNDCSEKWSCSITVHSIYSLSITKW